MAEKRDDQLRRAMEASLSLGGKEVEKDDDESSSNTAPVETKPAGPEVSASPVANVVAREDDDQANAAVVLRPEGPVGVDVGTTSIVTAESRNNKIHAVNQTDFPSTIPLISFTKNTLIENAVPYFEMNNLYYLQGYAADRMAATFNKHAWRPVRTEKVQRDEGTPLIDAILQNIIGRPEKSGLPLYYSIPGEPLEGLNTLVYHSAIIKEYFSDLGYTAMPVNEGLAVVMSELPEENFTGIAISIGGSMVNVCLSYLAVPLITFSIQKAGDYIDTLVAAAIDDLPDKVKEVKEGSFSLASKPKNRMEKALTIYYDDLIDTVIITLCKVLISATIPKTGAISLVLSGGTVKPEGFVSKFEKALSKVRLPMKISSVRMAEDPLNSVAKGALVMAMAEEK